MFIYIYIYIHIHISPVVLTLWSRTTVKNRRGSRNSGSSANAQGQFSIRDLTIISPSIISKPLIFKHN